MSTPVPSLPARSRPGPMRTIKARTLTGATSLVLDVAGGVSLPGAACLTEDPDLMYSTGKRSVERAKALCAGCPVQAECLEKALSTGETHGLWGGLTADERRRYLTSSTAVA